MILPGRSVSPGVVAGRARVLDPRGWLVSARAIEKSGPPATEVERLLAARARASVQLEQVEHELAHQGRKDEAAIFAAHRAMMCDPLLLEQIEERIAGGASAEAAVAGAIGELHRKFDASELPSLRDKSPDLIDIGRRLVRCLDPRIESRAPKGEAVVLVTTSLTPSDLISFGQEGRLAALVESCGDRSHAAILARSMGIPVLAGIEGIAGRIRDGAQVLVDAAAGFSIVDPEPHERAQFDRSLRAADHRSGPVHLGQPVTRDGVEIRLALNISSPEEARLVPQLGAAGVGLFRTEFMYMGRMDWPSEEDCLAAFSRTAQAVGDLDLQIRLADFGADKRPAYADFPAGRNPSLGARGIRLLLQRDDILAPQVRALARLAARRPLTVLLPMLDGIDSLGRIRERMAAACKTKSDRLPFALGAMIEVPAAALAIERIAAEVETVAIGLNDLTQYVMAADREDEAVELYHDALQPAILKLVHQVVVACRGYGIPVGVCGELAGDPALTAALLAIGVRSFSVSQLDYEGAHARIVELSVLALEQQRNELLAAGSGSRVREITAAMGRS